MRSRRARGRWGGRPRGVTGRWTCGGSRGGRRHGAGCKARVRGAKGTRDTRQLYAVDRDASILKVFETYGEPRCCTVLAKVRRRASAAGRVGYGSGPLCGEAEGEVKTFCVHATRAISLTSVCGTLSRAAASSVHFCCGAARPPAALSAAPAARCQGGVPRSRARRGKDDQASAGKGARAGPCARRCGAH